MLRKPSATSRAHPFDRRPCGVPLRRDPAAGRYKPLEFNGWTERHWTLPFQGERYSLVWFTPKGCEGVEGIDLFPLLPDNDSDPDAAEDAADDAASGAAGTATSAGSGSVINASDRATGRVRGAHTDGASAKGDAPPPALASLPVRGGAVQQATQGFARTAAEPAAPLATSAAPLVTAPGPLVPLVTGRQVRPSHACPRLTSSTL